MGSKGKGGRMRFQPPAAGSMMKQVQQLQAQMLEAQEQLATETVTVSVGGAVTVVMTGQQKLSAITINPEAVDPEDVDMLQDLIIAAVNEAVLKSREMAEQKMAPWTGALNMAGLL